MDWEPIVTHIASTHPALVVDGARRVRFANASMEELLGWNANELTERGWVATCVPQSDRSTVRKLVADGLSGSATEGDVPLVTRAGKRLTIRAGLSVEGHGRSRALVLFARDLAADDDAPGTAGDTCDCMVDLSRSPGRSGRVVALAFLDPARETSTWLGRPFEAFFEATGSSAAVRAVGEVIAGHSDRSDQVLIAEADDAFRVVAARVVDEKTVRVVVRCLDVRILPDLVEAKMARVAEARGLSERERQVLQLLLRGRGAEDIATMLEIAPRTVKFHQSNVLQKLGADSRLDLLRVVL
jgi:PAS domain S-box-containing protein